MVCRNCGLGEKIASTLSNGDTLLGMGIGFTAGYLLLTPTGRRIIGLGEKGVAKGVEKAEKKFFE